MMRVAGPLSVLMLLVSNVAAVPARRQADVTVLSQAQVATWTVPAYLAS